MARKTKPRERYRALVGLSYPTHPQVIEYLKRPDHLPMPPEWRGAKEVAAGEIVDDIPAVSVPWLLEQNLIELVEEVGDED